MQSHNEKLASKIAELLLDGDGIEKVEAQLGGFNFFEAYGNPRSERLHSDILAFLLDPNETHGLGTEFLTRFVVEVIKTMQPEIRPLSLSKVALTEFDGCVVRREYGDIDVLCIDKEHRFLLAIENKIASGEHSDQLRRYHSFLKDQYPDFCPILAFLTPENDVPSDDNWVSIGYGEVLLIVEALAAKHRERLDKGIGMALDHYTRMLRRHIVTDNELVNVAQAVYRKHKKALDIIFEHRPDDQLELSEIAADLASKDGRIDVVRRTKSYINFFPKAWNCIPAFNVAPSDEWTKSGHSLLFEVRNKPNYINIVLVIGPVAEDRMHLRKEIFDFATRNRELFHGVGRKLAGNFAQIYSKRLADQVELETMSMDDIRSSLESSFKSFMQEEFEKIVDTLTSAFMGT